MTIRFEGRREECAFLDPRREFTPIRVPFEVRVDPLTGATARVFEGRAFLPPWRAARAALEDQLPTAEACLFCAPRVESVTPKVPWLGDAGRVRVGEALAFPNLFPFATVSAVCPFTTAEHDLRLLRFTPRRIADALRACRDVARAAAAGIDGRLFGALHCNYLPSAGASVAHPHMQLLMDVEPLQAARRVLEGLARHGARDGSAYFAELLGAERAAGRGVDAGGVGAHFAWYAPFAPPGLLGLRAVGRRAVALHALRDEELDDLGRGLTRAFAWYESEHCDALNFHLVACADEGVPFPPLLTLIARAPLEGHYRSDVTAIEHLHQEVCVDRSPEVAASAARAFFAVPSPPSRAEGTE